MTKKQQLIIILGAPRSGIGLLKKLLYSLGLNTPKQIESSGSALDEADSILSAFFDDIGFNPHLPGQLPHNWQETEVAVSAKGRIKDLLHKMTQNCDTSVLGNPTMFRVMPLWLDVMDELGVELNFIHIIRHPWEVAKSLKQNDGLELDNGHRLWLAFFRDVSGILDSRNHLSITFDELIDQPINILRRISNSFNLKYSAVPQYDFERLSSIVAQNISQDMRSFHCEDMPSEEQDLYGVFERLYENTKLNIYSDESNIVWLTSYPRSGNTLLRIILNYNFGIKSYSIYNDRRDIGNISEVAEIVGHEEMDWSFLSNNVIDLQPEVFTNLKYLRFDYPKPILIKTHSTYHAGFKPDKVIYIYRDGRAALRSYASYQAKYSSSNLSEKDALDLLLCTEGLGGAFAEHVGLWDKHKSAWMEHPDDKIFFLKFEDMVSDFRRAILDISEFLGITPLRTDVLSFNLLNSINADFFRKGQKKSWEDILDRGRHALFWIMNYETMYALGYESDKSPVCDMLTRPDQENITSETDNPVDEARLNELDEILQECAEIITSNIDKHPNANWQNTKVKLKKAHVFFVNFFNKHALEGAVYSWMKEWVLLFELLNGSKTMCGGGATAPLLPNTEPVQRKVHVFNNGVKVFDDHLIPLQRQRYKVHNVHEVLEEELFVTQMMQIPNNGCFLDIGCAIGYYSFLAKITKPGIKVYCVEPLAKHIKAFKENIVLNGYSDSDFILFNEAINSHEGFVDFVEQDYSSKVLGVDERLENQKKTKKTNAVVLEQLLVRIPENIHLLKMDVQGTEYAIINSSRAVLKKGLIKAMIIGTHEGILHRKTANCLRDCGFRIEYDCSAPIGQPDGIIVATM